METVSLYSGVSILPFIAVQLPFRQISFSYCSGPAPIASASIEHRLLLNQIWINGQWGWWAEISSFGCFVSPGPSLFQTSFCHMNLFALPKDIGFARHCVWLIQIWGGNCGTKMVCLWISASERHWKWPKNAGGHWCGLGAACYLMLTWTQ